MSAVIALWMYFTLWIESSGKLFIENNTNALYVKDNTMKVARWYNLMAMFWTVQFFIGCQHMVIAGAVAIWYFTRLVLLFCRTHSCALPWHNTLFFNGIFPKSRNKDDIQSPIAISFKNMIKFHLGTVALGSFLISFIQMLRTVLRGSDVSRNNFFPSQN